MKKQIILYILAIVVVEALGFITGMLTRSGTELYATTIRKPPLSPPGILFPIAWTILYALMGVGIARVLLAAEAKDGTAFFNRRSAIVFFVIQLVLNLAWCFIFFGAQAYTAAFVELVIMFIAVVFMTIAFMKVDRAAGLMQIPYIVWLMFASYLNLGVIMLN